MVSFTLITPPAAEPVSLVEMKAQARVDTAADDALLSGLITAARQWAERYTGRAFITQGWRLWLDDAPCEDFVLLPRPPLASVTSVQVYDDSNASTVWDAGSYFVDTAREPGRLALCSGAVWPVPTRLANGIAVTYTAGYGEGGSAVPEPIRLAIKQLAAHWYEHRGEAVTENQRGGLVPLVIMALLSPYRVASMRA